MGTLVKLGLNLTSVTRGPLLRIPGVTRTETLILVTGTETLILVTCVQTF